MENPHQEFDDQDGDSRASLPAYSAHDPPGHSEFSVSRNASSNSLRSRSATGGSTTSASAHAAVGRPPARFPGSEGSALPPLVTQMSRDAQSPGETNATSYFSPVEKENSNGWSASTRSSSQSVFAGYNRQGTPGSSRPLGEETNRNTAPAMSRHAANGNPYLLNGRGPAVRPSMPPSGTVQSAQQLGMTMNRVRSASSPDMNPNGLQNRRHVNGHSIPHPEAVPNVPPIPAHVSGRVAPVNRSQNNSPSNVLPQRPGGKSIASQPHHGLTSHPRPHMTNHMYTYDASYQTQVDPRQYIASTTPFSVTTVEQTLSPPLSPSASDDVPFMPSQLKAKVRFDDNYICIVIASNIQFRSLIDRIDAKLGRFTHHSIGSGTVRLRYRDEDGDFVWIDSDEAVQEALLDWRETHVEKIAAGQLAEILLFAHSITGDSVTGS